MNTKALIQAKNSYSDEIDFKIDRIIEAKEKNTLTSEEARFLISILIKKELKDSLGSYFSENKDSKKSKGSVFLLNYLQKTTQ
jgi:hypothetical protein